MICPARAFPALVPIHQMPPFPRCHVVAGPNGSGKSTLALRCLPQRAGGHHVPDRLADELLSIENARRSAVDANAQWRP
jgi:predicted ABC-type ATPase